MFYKNAYLREGYDKRCKICKKNKITSRPFKEKKIIKKRNALGLHKPTKNDYENMFHMLKLIGYSPSNVHKEFCDKWKLPEKNRTKKDMSEFTYEDFDLFF